MTWDELERICRLIDPRADWHLANWANWMRRPCLRLGYPSSSKVVRSCAGDTWEDWEGDDAHYCATVSDAVIDGLLPIHQAAIQNVYLVAVWRHRGDPAQVFVEAAAEFWKRAKRKGLT